MKQVKDFDCVQMKWDIQQKLLREIDDLGEEEARRRQRERVANNPILGPFLHPRLTGETTDKPTRKAS